MARVNRLSFLKRSAVAVAGLVVGDRLIDALPAEAATASSRHSPAGFFPVGTITENPCVLVSESGKWLEFDGGESLDPNEYPDLFAAVGYRYGRRPIGLSKKDHFRLPDLRARVVVGKETTSVESLSHDHHHVPYWSSPRRLYIKTCN